MSNIEKSTYKELVKAIGAALCEGRTNAIHAVNTALVRTNWQIGHYIVEYEQKGKERAEYGAELLDCLSRDLTIAYGKGFSRSNVFQMRQFYLKFPIVQTLSEQLSWSHYIELIKIEDPLEISFYLAQSIKDNWSVRELQRQMKSMLFHRVALNKDKEQVLALSHSGITIQTVDDIIKDPYVLEFVGISQGSNYLESDLERELINNLQDFLLELGKGFAFIGRQYKINIGSRHFYVDLVFYHRILKCFVLIDLKRGEIEHNDIGQMNLYLNYLKKEENTEGDNDPIGIVLGAYKDEVLIEYATMGISNQLFVSKYQLYLPDKKQLQNELRKLMGNE
ncbi:MAG: PDDEXK nuclease domain-containing protein [Oscillospiraceae bacterium]